MMPPVTCSAYGAWSGRQMPACADMFKSFNAVNVRRSHQLRQICDRCSMAALHHKTIITHAFQSSGSHTSALSNFPSASTCQASNLSMPFQQTVLGHVGWHRQSSSLPQQHNSTAVWVHAHLHIWQDALQRLQSLGCKVDSSLGMNKSEGIGRP